MIIRLTFFALTGLKNVWHHYFLSTNLSVIMFVLGSLTLEKILGNLCHISHADIQ